MRSSSILLRRSSLLGAIALVALAAACSYSPEEQAPDEALSDSDEDAPALLDEKEALADGDIDEPVVRDLDDAVIDEPDVDLGNEVDVSRLSETEVLAASAVRTRCANEATATPAMSPPRTFDADAELAKAQVTTVPVVFHVIRSGNKVSQGNIPASRITAQIKVLNDSYGGKTGGAKMGFQFRLAKVERVTSSKWFHGTGYPGSVSDDMKRKLHVGGAHTLNIYSIAPSSNLVGIATFPQDYAAHKLLDGVIIHHASVPHGSLASYNRGDTATHEVGHWFSLNHTFDNDHKSCTEFAGDNLADTPAEKIPAFECKTRNSCPKMPGNDPIHNFMDYTTDACIFQFTHDQAAWVAFFGHYYRG